MPDAARPEVWLRGPLSDVSPLLQPVAHSLLQSLEEAERELPRLTVAQLWSRAGQSASAGFHALHAAGSLDRLFTYARGEALSRAQLAALSTESDPPSHEGAELAAILRRQVEAALAQLRRTDPSTLTESRAVGRAGLPSTVVGLLVHGAEHTQRHIGQMITTVRLGGA